MTNKYKQGEIGHRNWGLWEVLDCGESFCLKRLTLRCYSSISKQRHNYRSETWVVIAGSGTVTIDDDRFAATVGDVFYINAQQIHRLSAGEEGMVVIELQKGTLLDENDIERFV